MTLPIRVVPVGIVDRDFVDTVVALLAREYRVPCTLDRQQVDPAFAFHSERSQYHSTTLLESLIQNARDSRILGVTGVDLYIPILTFVFGEAQLDGRCAIVSYHRLDQEFYGLPPDRVLTRERLAKESVHEIGHTYGLTHCDDYECAMAAAHSVEWVDVKGGALCDACRARVFLGTHS